jgi:low affinity Fe/Cu permease
MKRIYRHAETGFEKLTGAATFLLGNSITFIVALGMVVFWLANKEFYNQEIRDSIRDIIHGVTFLSLFIIQKSFNHFSASRHLKTNELLASHVPAKNTMINVEEKSEHEITQLSKEYVDMAEKANAE